MFSLIKQEDEKFSHQSDWTWHWQGPSDWMFNYWQWLMRHRRQNHPPLAAAPLGQFLLRWNTSWIVGRHGQDVRERNINLDYYSNVFRKWQQLSCCEWAYLCSPCRCPLRWTCALRYTDTDTLQLAPTGHFISVVKDSLTCLSLTAQPPLYSSQSENLSNVVQHTVNT